MKILHAADTHIGAGIRDDFVHSERFNVFSRIFTLADKLRVDIVLLSGDLFEQESIKKHELNELIAVMSNSRARIFISPGNHDPATVQSYYRRENLWPENVHIFVDPKTIPIPDLRVTVSGAGFKNLYERESLLPEINKTLEAIGLADNYLNLGLMHGEYSAESLYNPINRVDLEQSKLDYLALGHIHKPDIELISANNTHFGQSGSPHPLDRTETGARGVHLLEYSGKRLISHEYISTASQVYLDLDLEINDLGNYEEILVAIGAAINAKTTGFGEYLNDLSSNHYEDYKISWNLKLRGTYLAEFNFNVEDLEWRLESISADFANLDVRFILAIDREALAVEDSLRGVFYRKMQARIKKSEHPEVLRRALELGLESFREE